MPKLRRTTALAVSLAVLIAAMLIASPLPAAATPIATAAPDLPVITLRPGEAAAGVGLTALPLDAAPYIQPRGRTMAPVRFTAESFGAQVEWSADSPLDVVITDGATTIKLTRGSSTAYINGSAVALDAPPELVNNRTFVPVRFVAEAFNANVLYDNDTRTVVISRLGHAPSLTELAYYAVQLINLDRLVNSLEPVAWDETAAIAARAHASEMAQNGYFSHWGLDGQLPTYRYTQVGGTDHVEENLAKLWYEGTGPFPAPDFLRVVSHESGLMNSPGHRANILDPYHTNVGVAMTAGDSGSTYLDQEFINRYGTYGALPKQQAAGQPLQVSGTLSEGVQFYGISLGSVNAQPMTVAQLNQTRSYSEPSPTVTFFPKGYVTPQPVTVSGQSFSLTIDGSQFQQAGTYYVYIWAVPDSDGKPVLVSARTVVVSK